ncbi:MAG: DMT family transporter [Rhodobacteraceae bacterium]|nr:DMT family transporter [Paracoccaceae bacterium]
MSETVSLQKNNIPAGIALMLGATMVFATQDGISRHLAGEYNTYMVVMIRYWFFAVFVVAIAVRAQGGIRAAAATSQPRLQIFRGVLLAGEVCVAVYGFTLLGLIKSQAVFICYPLLVAALSGPVLGEGVGWRRWAAIGAGFVGILIILQPGIGVFDPAAVLPLISALMFALYGLLTRFAARRDSTATSFFWTGVSGAVAMTLIGVWFWEPMARADWGWMAALCVSGVLGHWLLIKCYEMAEASAVQPFAYFHLLWAAILGVAIFGEVIRPNVAIGAAIILAAGLFTLWRARQTG